MAPKLPPGHQAIHNQKAAAAGIQPSIFTAPRKKTAPPTKSIAKKPLPKPRGRPRKEITARRTGEVSETDDGEIVAPPNRQPSTTPVAMNRSAQPTPTRKRQRSNSVNSDAAPKRPRTRGATQNYKEDSTDSVLSAQGVPLRRSARNRGSPSPGTSHTRSLAPALPAVGAHLNNLSMIQEMTEVIDDYDPMKVQVVAQSDDGVQGNDTTSTTAISSALPAREVSQIEALVAVRESTAPVENRLATGEAIGHEHTDRPTQQGTTESNQAVNSPDHHTNTGRQTSQLIAKPPVDGNKLQASTAGPSISQTTSATNVIQAVAAPHNTAGNPRRSARLQPVTSGPATIPLPAPARARTKKTQQKLAPPPMGNQVSHDMVKGDDQRDKPLEVTDTDEEEDAVEHLEGGASGPTAEGTPRSSKEDGAEPEEESDLDAIPDDEPILGGYSDPGMARKYPIKNKYVTYIGDDIAQYPDNILLDVERMEKEKVVGPSPETLAHWQKRKDEQKLREHMQERRNKIFRVRQARIAKREEVRKRDKEKKTREREEVLAEVQRAVAEEVQKARAADAAERAREQEQLKAELLETMRDMIDEKLAAWKQTPNE